MKYVISDLHGCYDKYQELLKKIKFGPEDTLYFLGDAIDRGPDGCKILLDMCRRSNVLPLLGNHEALAMDALPAILRCYDGSSYLTDEEYDAVSLWFYNGGQTTANSFLTLSKADQDRVWNYMKSMPLYREVEAGDRKFLLVHGGLDNFSPDKPLEDYNWQEIVWSRPTLETKYYPDRMVVLGHTPVQLLYQEGKAPAQPSFLKTDSFIDIDCGCVFREGRLGCLVLDTMEEIYV